MAMTYSTLIASKATTGSIKNLVNYERIDPDQILEDAQAHIYGSLRCREMMGYETLTVAIGDDSAPVPTGFRDPIMLATTEGDEIHNTDVGTLEKMRAQWRQSDGTLAQAIPEHYACSGATMSFECAWDRAATLVFRFYDTPDDLSASNETNFLTTRYPNLLRAAIRMYVADFRDDEPTYRRMQAQVETLIARANAEADLALRGGRFPSRS